MGLWLCRPCWPLGLGRPPCPGAPPLGFPLLIRIGKDPVIGYFHIPSFKNNPSLDPVQCGCVGSLRHWIRPLLIRCLSFADMLICYWVSSNTTKQDWTMEEFLRRSVWELTDSSFYLFFFFAFSCWPHFAYFYHGVKQFNRITEFVLFRIFVI